MANEGVNSGRRRFLTATTAVVGAVGAGFAAVPFISSWKPSARAKTLGAPVDVNISKLDNEPGMRMIVQWRGKPVWIFKRTPEQISTLASLDGRLVDPASDNVAQTPDFAKNEARALRPEVAVIVGICTHLGCSPTTKLQPGPQPSLPDDWQGGFLCPCHGSTFDMAGRVYKNKPAPDNLQVPRHMYAGDSKLVIGKDEKGEA